MLQPWDTMSLRLGLGVCASAGPWLNSNTPTEPPSIPSNEPLHGRAKRDPKAKMLYVQTFLETGVSLGHVWRN